MINLVSTSEDHGSYSEIPSSSGSSSGQEERLETDYQTVDWSGDFVQGRLSYRRVLSHPLNTLTLGIPVAWYKSQGWFFVCAIGLLSGVFATLIDVGSDFFSDIRDGVCRPNPLLSAAGCCPDRQLGIPCRDWVTWEVVLSPLPSRLAFCLAWGIYILAAMLMAFLSAFFVSRIGPLAAGSGIPETKTILSGFVIKRFLGFRTLVVKVTGLVLAVASGLMLGKEGPMVHVSCCIANLCSRLSTKYRLNESKKRELISCGAAAGVSVAFGAPIGGVLFSLEEASTYFPHQTMWRSFFGAGIAALTLLWTNPLYSGKLVLYEATFNSTWSIFEVGSFILLAIMGGTIGALFIRLNVRYSEWRSRKLKDHRIMEVVAVAALTAAVTFGMPLTRHRLSHYLVALFYECGQDSTVDTLRSTLCDAESTLGAAALLLPQLIVAAAVHFFLTVITFGAGVPAGLFVPSLVIGASLGRAEGLIMSHITSRWTPGMFPFIECAAQGQCVTPGIHALIGATAVLAGVTRMTVSLAVIILELTGGIDLILPIIVVTTVAKWAGDIWGKESIYERHIELQGFPFLPSLSDDNPLHAGSIMNGGLGSDGLVAVPDAGSVGEVVATIRSNPLKVYPVIHPAGTVAGVVDGRALRAALRHRLLDDVVAFTDDALLRVPGAADLSGIADMPPLQVAEDLPFARLKRIFGSLGTSQLLVTKRGRLLGVVTRKDLMRVGRDSHSAL